MEYDIRREEERKVSAITGWLREKGWQFPDNYVPVMGDSFVTWRLQDEGNRSLLASHEAVAHHDGDELIALLNTSDVGDRPARSGRAKWFIKEPGGVLTISREA